MVRKRVESDVGLGQHSHVRTHRGLHSNELHTIRRDPAFTQHRQDWIAELRLNRTGAIVGVMEENSRSG